MHKTVFHVKMPNSICRNRIIMSKIKVYGPHAYAITYTPTKGTVGTRSQLYNL